MIAACEGKQQGIGNVLCCGTKFIYSGTDDSAVLRNVQDRKISLLRVGVPRIITYSVVLDIPRWSCSRIFPYRNEGNTWEVFDNFNANSVDPGQSDVSPQLYGGCFFCKIGGGNSSLSCFTRVVDGRPQTDDSEDANNDLREREAQHFYGGISHGLRRCKVCRLTTLGRVVFVTGGFFAALAAGFFGLPRLFDGPQLGSRLLGLGLIVTLAPLAGILWSWAVYDSPWSFWTGWGDLWRVMLSI